MRVKLLHDCSILTPIAEAGTWRDVEPDAARHLIGHGYARSESGLFDRTVPKPDKPVHAMPKPTKSFANFIRAVARRDTYYIERHYNTTFRVPDVPDREMKAALAESSGPLGGYLVPPRFSRRILALVNERALLRRAGAQVLPMESATLQIPGLDVTSVPSAGVSPFFGGLTLTWTGEAQTRTETEPQFKQMELKAWELSGYLTLSRALYDDGQGLALDAFLTNAIAEAVAWTEDLAFLQGNGVGKPQGLVTAPAALAVTRTAANRIEYADVSAMLSKLPPGSLDRAVWAFHPTALPQLLQLQDGANRAVFLQAGSGTGVPPVRSFSLAGFPAFPTEKLPALGTRGDLLLLDPGYYVIGDRTTSLARSASEGSSPISDLEVSVSEVPSFLKNQLTLRVVKRVDGQPWLNGPITLQDAATQVSPFVVLN